MSKGVKDILAKRASEFVDVVFKDLVEQNVPSAEKMLVIAQIQTALFELLESPELESGVTTSGQGSKKDEKDALVKKIKRFIDDRKLSYAEAAKIFGISAGPLCNWLTGKTHPSRTSVLKLKEVLKKHGTTKTEEKSNDDEAEIPSH
jgi:predicted XRE-type DNA-binding protein